MKVLLSRALRVGFVLTLLLTLGITMITSPAAAQVSDGELALQSGETFIAETGVRLFPEWSTAKLTDGVACTDLQGNVIAYLFAISLDGKVCGRIVVGSSVYNHGILQAGNGPFPTPPSIEKTATELCTQRVPQPSFLYLGYDRFYVKYRISGRTTCYDMMTGESVDFDNLSTSLASPVDYKKSVATPDVSIKLGVMLYPNPLNVPLHAQYNQSPWPRDCGPTTGAMITEYYKNICYTQFWDWPADHHDMYIRMYTNNYFPLYWGTAPWNFGPGIVSYAAARGANGWTTDWCVNGSFTRIQTEINSGRPLGVMFSYSDYTKWHWCAIKGYSGTDTVIINNPGGVGYQDTISWAANKSSCALTRIFAYLW